MHQQPVFDDSTDEGPSKCSTVLYYTWKICKCLFSHVLLVSMVVMYCIMGAFTFRHLEAENEIAVKENISKIRNNVTSSLWDLTERSRVLHQENWTLEVEVRLADFEKELVRCIKTDGWDGSEDTTSVQWTLSGALFYSIIVITTIGYGHIAPKTHWGKVVTIFYAILGIPLMLLCLSNIGDLMAHSFRFLYWRVCCYACTRRPRRPPPPAALRRGRSVRLPARSQSASGRFAGRSRPASFRRSGRTSQRSADSALGLSESMTRSSYSDTECRYYDDMDLMAGGAGLRGPNRGSQRSRFSDTAVQLGRGRAGAEPAPAPAEPVPGSGDLGEGLDPEAAARVPVLFNKYALERAESTARRNRRSTRNGGGGGGGGGYSAPPSPSAAAAEPGPSAAAALPRQHLALDVPSPPPLPPSPMLSELARGGGGGGGGSPRRGAVSSYSPSSYPGTPRSYLPPGSPSRPRIMSPMGFAISRQQSQTTRSRSSRLSRLREDPDYDDFVEYGYVDYEYEESYSSGQNITKPVPIWLCVFLVVTYIFCGAYLFHEWEGWHFLDSAYFCFITLTTIGFGDFVPAQRVRNDDNEGKISIALCSLYLLFGIALLAMSFNLVQEEVIGNVKSVAKRLGIIKDDEEEEED